jgi:hypothetical protein
MNEYYEAENDIKDAVEAAEVALSYAEAWELTCGAIEDLRFTIERKFSERAEPRSVRRRRNVAQKEELE